MFSWMLIFDPNWLFCKGYSPCMMADFQNRLISRTFGVFSIGFLHRTTLTWLKNRFLHVFLNFEFLTQTDYFAKAIAFAWWPIFKIVSFLEYLVSLSSGLLQKTTLTWLKNLLSHVFLNVNFWPKLTIFQRLLPPAWLPIFKIVSFLEDLVFSQSFFCTEQV